MKLKITILSLFLCITSALAIPLGAPEQLKHDDHKNNNPVQQGKGHAHCTDGVANGFACNGIDMLANVPLAEMGGGDGADGWVVFRPALASLRSPNANSEDGWS